MWFRKRKIKKNSFGESSLFPDKTDAELREMLNESIKKVYPDLFKNYTPEEAAKIDKEFQELFNMAKNEIKKQIYKQKPKAYLRYIREGVAYYYCKIYDYNQKNNGEQIVEFKIPCTTYEMGNADFTAEMDAKLLLRWMQKQDENFQN